MPESAIGIIRMLVHAGLIPPTVRRLIVGFDIAGGDTVTVYIQRVPGPDIDDLLIRSGMEVVQDLDLVVDARQAGPKGPKE